jgi:hypothetical protein
LMCVMFRIPKKSLPLQHEYDEHDSAYSRMNVKPPNVFHTQEVAGSNPASRTSFTTRGATIDSQSFYGSDSRSSRNR